jgi:hypothetical protein
MTSFITFFYAKYNKNDQVKMIKWARQVAHIGKIAYTILVKKRQGETSLGGHRRTWEDSTTGWGDMDWIHLAQDRNHWRAVAKT